MEKIPMNFLGLTFALMDEDTTDQVRKWVLELWFRKRKMTNVDSRDYPTMLEQSQSTGPEHLTRRQGSVQRTFARRNTKEIFVRS